MSSSQLRRHLSATLDQVTDDREPVIITREGDKPPAVIMSLEDYNSYAETDYLLRSPRNAEELRESIAEIEGGGGTERELIE